MFSANENLALRQHKRRIVQRIEATMPEEALDMGTTVMVMQVSCKAPGCVPLETAIIVIFPASNTELVPGLKESKNGGSFKTKILKPMADVDDDDILDALPPTFIGGRRSMEKLCLRARDVMIAQITQLFGEESNEKEDRYAMAIYLQQCLQQYIDHDCIPPELDQPYPNITQNDKETADDDKDCSQLIEKTDEVKESGSTTATPTSSIPAKGNFVIKRGQDDDALTHDNYTTSATTTTKAYNY